MSAQEKGGYVLGTHDAEIERLALQHSAWRATVLECWRRAGITIGSRVLDVGAGPGTATVDLAEIVGPTGAVIAVERSPRFVQYGRELCAQRGFRHVSFLQGDLMEGAISVRHVDFVWCRWTASFVNAPPKLVTDIAEALRPGGRAIIHEYFNYATWTMAPPRPRIDAFVQEVMATWRASGGEPNIAAQLVSLLPEAGLLIVDARPHLFSVHPSNYLWQWPVRFAEVNLDRLVELKRVEPQWAESVRQEFRDAAADSRTIMITPLVLEIVAEKRQRIDPPRQGE